MESNIEHDQDEVCSQLGERSELENLLEVQLMLQDAAKAELEYFITSLNQVQTEFNTAKTKKDQFEVDRLKLQLDTARIDMLPAKHELVRIRTEVELTRRQLKMAKKHCEEKGHSSAFDSGQTSQWNLLQTTFVEQLRKCHINEPNKDILAVISKRFPQQLQAALLTGEPEVCLDLYNEASQLPTSFTRGVLQGHMNISINGPISLSQPNILIGVLGDFGSTRDSGDVVWSYTQVLSPFFIPLAATVHASLDYVQLCIMIAVEWRKDTWKEDLCGRQQHVEEMLVRKRLEEIHNPTLRNEVLILFEEQMRLAQKHISSFTSD